MLASQAAIAIQNARLYEQRIKDMIVLQKINTAVTTGEWTEIGTLEKVLHLIVESLIDVFQGVSCAIRLHDPTTGQFGARIASGVLQERVKFSPRTGGASQQILRTKEAIYAQDPSVLLLNGEPVIRKEIQKEGIQAVAYLPLLSEENVIGILYLEWDAPRRFFENEKRILELFAGQAAVSIKNARLFDELGVRAKQLVRLQEITSIISAEPSDPGKVLHMIVESIDDVFEGASCEITLYNPRTKEFTVRNAVGVLKEEVKYLPRFGGTSEHVIQTRKPLYVEDTLAVLPSGQPAIRERIRDRGIKAVANLPLVGERDVIGVLYVGWTKPRHFSDNDKQILELFAHQAVIAMENARLFEQIQTLSQLGADLAALDREV
jgi:two-component system NtrC family sensor kinase